MKSGGTSTNKKKTQSKKNSTSSASAKKKQVTKNNTKSKNQTASKKKNTSVNNNNSQKQSQNIKKVQNTTQTRVYNQKQDTLKNTKKPNSNQNTKLKEDDLDFVPFLDDEEFKGKRNPKSESVKSNLRQVQKDEYYVKKPTKKKSKVRPIVVLEITFLIAIIVAGVYLMFTLETFNISKIEVKGNDKYTENEIISGSGLTTGQNVFKELLIQKNEELSLSYVSSVKYSYSFPSTVIIEVEERYPSYIALDKNTSKYYMIDNEGYLLEECTLDDKTDDILLIEGFVFEEDVELGQKIDEVYINKIETYKTIEAMLEKYEIVGDITRVNFTNSLTTIVLDDKLKIQFSNDSNLEYKVSFLKGIIDQIGGIEEGSIDMSIDNPVYSKYE